MEFVDFFRRATESDSEPEGRKPYPYQERFAKAASPFHLVRAPTGAGKTATAVLGWLWRLLHSGKGAPRRLVYCLPMRVLVEQSEAESRHWIKKLGLEGQIKVFVLMGGLDTEQWFLRPHRSAILIGTQDMLLSRALNRGYAASRFHWPIDFGLLNNDCLWVFDEPQLMANGVSTSAQLAGLRQALGTFGNCSSVWMSATLEASWLDTIDFRGKFPGPPLELGKEDYDPTLPLRKRMIAKKTLARLHEPSSKDMKHLAKQVEAKHIPGTQTLVVLNTVDRAKTLFTELKRLQANSVTLKLLLVHSRYRAQERQDLSRQLQEKGKTERDRIIVATQVVEAGIDISSRTLISDLAPWASIVQRVGRCNRTGDDGPGQVWWIDLDEKSGLPYSTTALDFARTHLNELQGESVSPKALDDYKREKEKPAEPFLPFDHKHVLRRKDLLDFFDTSPDLAGNDIDVQRFVRSDDLDTDVKVFWREIPPDKSPNSDEPGPVRRELCSVPVNQGTREFLQTLIKKKRGAGYIWDHMEGQWRKVDPRQLRPGLTILLPATAGGYSALGWDPNSATAVTCFPPEVPQAEEGIPSDPDSALGVALTIAEHSQHVCDQLTILLDDLDELLCGWREVLGKSARWHDVGKALLVCQKAMYGMDDPDPSRLLAKSGRRGKLNYGKYGRKQFRHELGSAIAVLQTQPEWPFLVAYLIASHHGRVRLSIRAVPGENPPPDGRTRFALGVQDGDELPEVDLGCDARCPPIALDLSPMEMGGMNSWTAQALTMLTEQGPFKLAYLEAILRAADVRASQKEAGNAPDC